MKEDIDWTDFVKKNTALRLIVIALISLLLYILLVFICNTLSDKISPDYKGFLLEIPMSFFVTCLAIMLIDGINKESNDKIVQEMIKKMFVSRDAKTLHEVYSLDERRKLIEGSLDSMSNEERAETLKSQFKRHREIVLPLYSDEDKKSLMTNCLRTMVDKSSAETLRDFVFENTRVTRRNFVYKVKLTENLGRCFLNQDITYIRQFTQEDNRGPKHLRCLFSLSDGVLNAMLNQSYFFREELEDIKLLAQIDEVLADEKCSEETRLEQIVKMLNMSLDIFKPKIGTGDSFGEDIPILSSSNKKIIKDGSLSLLFKRGEWLCLEYTIPEQYLSYSEDGRYCCYKAQLTCEYPTPELDHFYCVFSEHIVGTTIFEFDFNGIVDVSKVKRMSFLSPINEKATLRPRNNKISFSCQEDIYPRSGIALHWVP